MAGGQRRRGEALRGAGLAALLCALHVQAACQDATVTQELLKEGFHRDLLVKVELGVVGEDAGGCAVAARTRLPPGIYVDPYELASLQQHNLTKAVLIPDVIDVEAPEYLATDLLVLLYMEPDPQCSRCFRAALPVHGRYHRPAEESEEALVVLKSPEVLVCCCDIPAGPDLLKVSSSDRVFTVFLLAAEAMHGIFNIHYQEANKEKWKNDCFGGREIVTVWLKSRGLQANDEFFALLRTEGPRFHTDRLSAECWKPAEVEASCSGKNVGPCQWYSITHKPAYKELILQVPVGLRQHSSLVCVVTLLATVLCSSLILAAVCKYGHFSPVAYSE